MVFELLGCPKELNSGDHFGLILGSILTPFWVHRFGVGRPAEIRILPSLNPGPGPEVRKLSRPGP